MSYSFGEVGAKVSSIENFFKQYILKMVSPSSFLPDLSHLSNYPIPSSLLLPPSFSEMNKNMQNEKNTGNTHTL